MSVEQLELWNRLHGAEKRAAGQARAKGVRLDPQLANPRLRVVTELDQLEVAVQSYIECATAASTRRIYRHGWSRFERWCAKHARVPLPASPETVAMYVADLAKCGRAYSSLRNNLAAIAKVHVAASAGRPDRDDRVRVLMRGIGRSIGTRAEGARALQTDALAALVGALGSSPRDTRDRALLLLGFAGAYRSSDLATLNVEHVRFTTDGMEVLLSRSKEDPLGLGSLNHYPMTDHATLCPVRALRAWLELSPASAGPLFRVIQGGRIYTTRIHPRSVTRALQRAVGRAGIVDAHYSSHSLRRGFATVAHERGVSLRDIQVHGRWTFLSSVARYVELPNPARLGKAAAQVLAASRSFT
jgi:integrase